MLGTDFRKLTVLGLLFTFLGLSTLRAETVLVDDFNDGDDAGWFYSTNNVPEDGATWIVDQGAYSMSTKEEVGVGQQGQVLSFWEDSLQPKYQNGLVRAKVRANTQGTSTGLVLRSSDGSIDNGYLFIGSGDSPVFNIWRCVGSVDDCTSLGTIPRPFRAGEDWWLEAGVVDDMLSFKVWMDGDEEPDSPQFNYQDRNVLGPGYFGMGGGISRGWFSPAINSTTFDDVTFTLVPEPSALAMVPIGGLALLCLRRNRVSRRRIRLC